MHAEVALGVAATAVKHGRCARQELDALLTAGDPRTEDGAVVTVGEVGGKFVAIGS
jgi:hypothetical protein